tara:strand:- start:26 stop:349 length:324 start_codon:yes stop_codon:yes gene_type:complete
VSLLDTYQLATAGQNFKDTFTLATNGILIGITITPIPFRPGGGSSSAYKKREEEKERKKITVIVTIDNKKYTESVIVEDQPNLTVEDVHVEVHQTENRPKITISIKK